MTRLSVSLPEELSRQLRRIQARERVRLSHIVADALRVYFATRPVQGVDRRPRDYPTVLWKLKATGRFVLRSPRLSERRLREGWVVEEY